MLILSGYSSILILSGYSSILINFRSFQELNIFILFQSITASIWIYLMFILILYSIAKVTESNT